MEGFAPEELAAVFGKLQAAGWDAVLVGGQAVNLWARRYERDVSAWDVLRPYTSRDLDYHGGLAEARLAMRTLHAHGHLNTGADPSPNAGVLKVSLADGRELLIMVLVVREWLTEQLSAPRSVFRTVERLAACAASPDGVHAFVRGIDLTEALPLDAMRAKEGFSDFLTQRLPQLLSKIARKRQQHRDAIHGQDSDQAGC